MSSTQEDLAEVKWKCHSVFEIRDFSLVHEKFNSYLSKERRRALHTHLTQIYDKYVRMELEEIQPLKAGALPEGSNYQRAAFLTSINKDYEVLVKDEEDSSKDSSEEC